MALIFETFVYFLVNVPLLDCCQPKYLFLEKFFIGTENDGCDSLDCVTSQVDKRIKAQSWDKQDGGLEWLLPILYDAHLRSPCVDF